MNMNKWMKGALGVVAAGAIIGVGISLFNHQTDGEKTKGSGYVKELKAPGKLTIGLEGNYAPFSYKNKQGKLVGYDVDVAKAVAKELKLKPVFVETKFDSLVAGLDANKYDVVFNDMGETPERREHYTFGSQYLYSQSVMIVRKDSTIKTIKDIKGKRAAQTTSSNYGKAAQKAGAKIVGTPGFAEGLDLISAGKADVMLNADDAWSIFVKKHPKTNLKAIPTKDVDATGAAPMLNKQDKALAKAISKAEQKLAEQGTLRKLSEQYFGKDLTTKLEN